ARHVILARCVISSANDLVAACEDDRAGASGVAHRKNEAIQRVAARELISMRISIVEGMDTYGGALRHLRQKAPVWQSSLTLKPAHQAQVQSEPAAPAHGPQWPPADRQGLHALPAHDGQGQRSALE